MRLKKLTHLMLFGHQALVLVQGIGPPRHSERSGFLLKLILPVSSQMAGKTQSATIVDDGCRLPFVRVSTMASEAGDLVFIENRFRRKVAFGAQLLV